MARSEPKASAAFPMKANEVRIVGGTWRSRRIRFTPRADIRPSPDRVRETLFNWLGQDLTGLTCLDLFAGSGALGFEAASRGARRVVMVERDRTAFESLRDNREALQAAQVELVRGDALEFVRADRAVYDVIFLDPPFAADYWPTLVPLLPARLTAEGLVYCESGASLQPQPGWEAFRTGRAGQVNYQLLKRNAHEPYGDLPGDVRSDHAGS
jgi:16S rRNA (guanine966-N2)-methyltransferase